MKKYGIVLSDGGNIALTAEDDMFTAHKWSEFGFDEDEVYLEEMLIGVPITAFEVVETGPQIPLTYDCDSNGNTLTPADFIFIDGYDY
jgi:serine/threonine-protein kinase